jgi:hypothetical protein
MTDRSLIGDFLKAAYAKAQDTGSNPDDDILNCAVSMLTILEDRGYDLLYIVAMARVAARREG